MSWTKDWVDELYDSGDEEYTMLKWFALSSRLEEEKDKQKNKEKKKEKNSKDWNCKNTSTSTNTNTIKSV